MPSQRSDNAAVEGEQTGIAAFAQIPTQTAGALERLQIELRDLAFDLDRKGNLEAADVATIVAARLAELLAESNSASKPLDFDKGGISKRV